MEFDTEPEYKEPLKTGSKWLVPGSILIAGLLVAGSFIYSGQLQRQNPEPSSVSTTQPQTASPEIRPVGPDDHIFGSPNAKVLLVEYSDFECPFCNRFHKTMHTIMQGYGKEGDVAWVYRHFPVEKLHKKSFRQAMAAECAAELGGNDAFWDYADLIFANTDGQDGLDMALLPDFAEQLGLSREAFNACMQTERTRPKVQRDLDEALAAGAKGTPYSVLITGGKTIAVPGNMKPEALAAIFQTILNQGVHSLPEDF